MTSLPTSMIQPPRINDLAQRLHLRSRPREDAYSEDAACILPACLHAFREVGVRCCEFFTCASPFSFEVPEQSSAFLQRQRCNVRRKHVTAVLPVHHFHRVAGGGHVVDRVQYPAGHSHRMSLRDHGLVDDVRRRAIDQQGRQCPIFRLNMDASVIQRLKACQHSAEHQQCRVDGHSSAHNWIPQ